MTHSLSSYITDQLESHGFPHQYIHTFSRMFLSSDIVTLAIRLALVSIIVSQLKTWITRLYHYIYNSLFVTAHVAHGAADWIRGYLYQDPDVQSQLLQFRLIAEDEATGAKRSKASNLFKSSGATFVKDGVCFRATPLDYRKITILHKGRKLWLTRSHLNHGNMPSNADYFLLTTYVWNRQVITDFILDAHKIHHEKNDSEIHIFNHTPKVANWEGPVIRPTRPWASVILPGTVKDDLLKDVKDFVSEDEKTWYASRGIPHRRGYLLHGPPGTGKTTLATALASKLNMDLYIINPAAPGMDNGKLQKCFRTCPKGSLLLIEDIDCVMPRSRGHRGGTVSADDENESQNGDIEAEGDGPHGTGSAENHALGPSSVTLSGLLNAIDGVASQEDSVLFASTNYPDKLDEALRRPGRFDVHVPFAHATPQQASDLYKHFYPSSTNISTGITSVSSSLDTETAIMMNEKTPADEMTTADQSEVDRRAEEFAKIISDAEIKVSIAVIQGYLLLYKKDPITALEKAREWAEAIRDEQSGTTLRSIVTSSGNANANVNVNGGAPDKMDTVAT